MNMEQAPDPMEKTGKNNKLFVTTEGVFLNSKCLFIEYEDVLKSPMFSYLYIMKDQEFFRNFFDISELQDLSMDELYEWYLHRDSKNIFYSLELSDEFYERIPEEKMDELRADLYIKSYEEAGAVIKSTGELNFAKVLHALLDEKGNGGLVKDILVWHPFYVEGIAEDLKEKYGTRVKFVYGNFIDVIKENKVTEDSTFIFSDMYHILDLEEAGIIDFSSIIIADEYWYNYDTEFNPVILPEEILEAHIVKLDFFNNITSV